MIDFIPPLYYFPIYINTCLGIVIFTLLHSSILPLDAKKNIILINNMGILLIITLILYLGLRPIHWSFGDTVNYYVAFKKFANGGSIKNEPDYGWALFMKFMSYVISIYAFFTLCVFLYIYPMFRISKKLFKTYWYYAFLMFVVSFSFFTYAVNGIRNGVALSLFLWGLCYTDKKIIMGLFFLAATLCHKTALLPIFAFILTYFYNDTKVYLKIWLMCIPLSLAMGGVFIIIFSSIGFADERLSGYLTSQSEGGTFASTGFRWDFLFHSAFAVFAGWYFVIKKQFKDSFYSQLLNTYLICNAFWILVIKANYSNRFAYLSWFMMALIIIYPLLKQQFFKNQHLMIGKIMLLYFGFTYFMYMYYEYLR